MDDQTLLFIALFIGVILGTPIGLLYYHFFLQKKIDLSEDEKFNLGRISQLNEDQKVISNLTRKIYDLELKG